MKPTVKDKAEGRLAELDELGTVDESAYALPLDNPDGEMAWDQLVAQQKRETQSGRWQVMAARHWFHMAMQAEEKDEAQLHYYYAEACFWEAMHNAKGKKARLTNIPDKGGRPSDESKALLYQAANEIIEKENCKIIEGLRRAVLRDMYLKTRYFGISDKRLRNIFEEHRKIDARKPPRGNV